MCSRRTPAVRLPFRRARRRKRKDRCAHPVLLPGPARGTYTQPSPKWSPDLLGGLGLVLAWPASPRRRLYFLLNSSWPDQNEFSKNLPVAPLSDKNVRRLYVAV